MTMQNYAVYLEPKGSFTSSIYSDTLFGAVCWAIRAVYDEKTLTEFLEGFNKSPLFLLSSAFPYLKYKDKIVRFYPKPLLPELRSSTVEKLTEEKSENKDSKSLEFKRAKVIVAQKLKELKKILYVSENIFRDIVEGRNDMEALYRKEKFTGAVQQDIEKIGNALITFAERERIDPNKELSTFIREADVQHNQIDRVAGSTVEGMLFYEKEIFLQRSMAGLWFILYTDDLEFLKPAFRYLEDTGIGGNRTAGKGQFNISLDRIDKLEIPEANEPNAFIVLSRYLPNNGEFLLNSSPMSYTLLNLRGKHESKFPIPGQPIYKELLRIFGEGSIFPLKEPKPYYGKLEKVGEFGGRKIYQNGLTVPVFAKIMEAKQ